VWRSSRALPDLFRFNQDRFIRFNSDHCRNGASGVDFSLSLSYFSIEWEFCLFFFLFFFFFFFFFFWVQSICVMADISPPREKSPAGGIPAQHNSPYSKSITLIWILGIIHAFPSSPLSFGMNI